MKFEKPGPKIKNRPSTKRLYVHDIEVPKDRSCKNCNVETDTECFHHAESSRIKFLSGGGIMGGKINDRLTAWLCNQCGEEFDRKPDKMATQYEKDQHDLFSYDCIAKTHLI